MYSERIQVSTKNIRSVVNVHAEVLPLERARRAGFPDYNPGSEQAQIVLAGTDVDDKIVKILPIVLSAEEEKTAKGSKRGYSEICQQIEETYSKELLD